MPMIRRTSALVTQWSQNCGHWPPKSFTFNDLPIILDPIHRADILVNQSSSILHGKKVLTIDHRDYSVNSSLAVDASVAKTQTL
jgi:hypothetical protein